MVCICSYIWQSVGSSFSPLDWFESSEDSISLRNISSSMASCDCTCVGGDGGDGGHLINQHWHVTNYEKSFLIHSHSYSLQQS